MGCFKCRDIGLADTVVVTQTHTRKGGRGEGEAIISSEKNTIRKEREADTLGKR